MSYTKQTWHTGDLIIDSKLNHIEQGVADAGCELFLVNVGAVSGTPTTYIPDMTYAEVMAKINDGYLPIYKINHDGGSVYKLIEGYTTTAITINTGGSKLVHDSTGVHLDSGWTPE